MRTTTYILGIALILTGQLKALGQNIDEERLERDLKVAENILATLSNNEGKGLYRENVESAYIPDYGVIFTIPIKSIIYTKVNDERVVYSYSSGSAITVVDEIKDVRRDKKEKDAPTAPKVPVVEEINTAELREKFESETKEQMITFLADYADLIGQLKPSDRIVIQTRSKSDVMFYDSRRVSSKSGKGIAAQVTKESIRNYKQGKISREAFVGQIDFSSREEEIAKDIELFSTIFARLYERDLSTTYYLSTRRIDYVKLKNLGVTFNLKFYSSTSDDGLHTIMTTGEGGLTQEERNEKVNAMYPEFERSFKENVLDYGRTIKSLDPNEMLIFKVKLTQCIDCEMPKEIEVKVRAKTLADYDKGSLSKNKAIEQVEVKRKD